MFGIQRSKQRFSLYNLDEGEMFIKGFVANVNYYHPLKKDKLQQKGMLYVASRSILFEPDDVSFNLVKFNFKEIKAIPYIKPAEPRQFTLHFELNRLIQIPTDFKCAYKFYEMPKDNKMNEVVISLVFEQTYAVATIINELFEKFHNKESSFEFDSVEYMGSVYTFKFDLTLIKSINEKFTFDKELYIKQLLPLIEVPGLMRITDQRLYFQPLFKIGAKRGISVKFKKVTQLYKRKVTLQHIGIEIITNKKSLLFQFENEEYRDIIYNIILRYSNDNNCETNISIDQYMRDWVEGKMSNYDYLIKLNSAANRTRNDLSQYPVFPWTLNNFSSETIDLNDKNNYRDLSTPIGATNPKRLNDFIKRYHEMPEPKFIYGTHYSNSAYVIGYLAREYPEYMLKLHSGKFDNPDRLFQSIEMDWNISYSNPGSIKELIPEFYENNTAFLLNNKRVDLGVNSKGEKINEVKLPTWAESPSHFLEVMRKALESDYVSLNLHKWIDLIFGYQQRGEEAIKANNLFHPVSYEDGNNFKTMSEMDKKIIQIQATEFGQCPTQLFTVPHPQRFSKESLNKYLSNIIHYSFDKTKLPSQLQDKNSTLNVNEGEGSLTDKGVNKVSKRNIWNFKKMIFTSLPNHHKE